MQCPKCQHESPAGAIFCTRCHHTLFFKCPACSYLQTHGGTCEKCGVDFAKYVTTVVVQKEIQMANERKRSESRSTLYRQIFLLPITGGISLVRHLLARVRGA